MDAQHNGAARVRVSGDVARQAARTRRIRRTPESGAWHFEGGVTRWLHLPGGWKPVTDPWRRPSGGRFSGVTLAPARRGPLHERGDQPRHITQHQLDDIDSARADDPPAW